MVNGDRNRKLLVRSAFVTGSTIAVLIGAQNLAMLDARQFETSTPENTSLSTIESPMLLSNQSLAAHQSPEIAVTIVQAPPSITILRQAGNPSTSINNSQQTVIQPPLASLMATPAPIFVQSQAQPQVIVQQSNQPARQSSRPSR